VSNDVRIFPDLETASRECARAIVQAITARTTGGDRFTLALAGGETPRALYRILATEHRTAVSWGQVHLFWGDERYVPPDDPRSNYRLVRDTLLGAVPIPPDNVHPMPTDFPDPRDAAQAYERDLRTHFPPPWPRLDLILLGLGSDGHTASLFPGSAALHEQERWVVDVRAPVGPPSRLTLTLPVLNHAASIFFLAAGAEKADALRRALIGSHDPLACPAAAVRPVAGGPVWWVDEMAAALIRRDRGAREAD
jgi:6-phosphogluconolactonase